MNLFLVFAIATPHAATVIDWPEPMNARNSYFRTDQNDKQVIYKAYRIN